MTFYGRNMEIRVFGGSHDAEIGITVEGMPGGISLHPDTLQAFLARRSPGQSPLTSTRREPDIPVFTSGVDENNVTNGETFRAIIRNTDARSADYEAMQNIPRPSHADYPAYVKFHGKADLRGGGHFSGRLTAPLCILGGIFKTELEQLGIHIGAHLASVGSCEDMPFDPVHVSPADFERILHNGFPVLDAAAGQAMQACIEQARLEQDSIGGVIECAVTGLSVGLGEHMFAGMESRIASLVFSIPGIKGVEFGSGFAGSRLRGSENNDPYLLAMDGDKKIIRTETNHAGGILGGMTTGMPLLFRAAVKPTPSIGREQKSVRLDTMEPVSLTIPGRHDPFIGTRAVPVIEAAAAIVVFDALLDYEEEPEV